MQSEISVFEHLFETLTGNRPFPWQAALYEKFESGEIPSTCDLPTGLGKTNVIAVWLIAWLLHPDKMPRRLVYVVNRRTVVDQTTIEVEKLRKNIKKLPGISEDAKNLAISTLRGQFADNREWSADPSRPAVICGTVDMIGSRLLFSGYGIGFKAKPLHAGFLGQDVLLVHDEAHLEPAFQKLLETIEAEQAKEATRSVALPWPKLRVMALSATVRSNTDDSHGKEPFGLTSEEKSIPATIPGKASEPIHVVWKRTMAKKALKLHEIADEKSLADTIAKTALTFETSGCAILVFVRRVEDVDKVMKALSKQKVCPLTGTMRGYERDGLVKSPIFQRFLPKSNRTEDIEPEQGTVYLVCTSAGEVGVNISADHMVCDLSTWESIAQRFGRVNRFGDRADTQIHVVHPSSFGKGDKTSELDLARQKTLALLQRLHSDASPANLGKLPTHDKSDAFAPPPKLLPATDILFDAWALTTVRDKLPGRPPVEPYLHGISEWEPPRTQIAWREEVDAIFPEELRTKYPPQDLLEDFPLKPHEILSDQSDRVFTQLAKLAERKGDHFVWLMEDDGTITPEKLSSLANKNRKERIENRTVLLPPSIGGLNLGHLDGSSTTANDVSCLWFNERGEPRRARVWKGDGAAPAGMRLVRTIDTTLSTEEESEPSIWRWFERPESGDTDGSKTYKESVLWQDHTDDVTRAAMRIGQRLLPEDLRNALVVAARFHDLGKRRPLFQRLLGNFNPKLLLAKSGKKTLRLPERYRHEFGSLLDVSAEPEFQALNSEMQGVVLHLIAVHHGRGRPHFPLDEAYDPDYTQSETNAISVAAVSRYARLQRKYGRWGLAYLESLLRAADWEASANPSKVYSPASAEQEVLA